MKIVVFGTGIFFLRRQDILLKEEIIAFIDNDKNKWSKKIDNIPISPPNKIKDFFYDRIVIMSRQEKEMRSQLVHNLGVNPELILDFEQYCEYSVKIKDVCKLEIHYRKQKLSIKKNKKKILFITDSLNYNGGSLAIFYAALSLKEKGFETVIATKKANVRLINEIVHNGITVFVQELLDYCEWEQIRWAEQFDYVIVNTLQLGRIIKELINRKPVLWWIHESKAKYEYLNKSIIKDMDNMGIETYVVSEVALHTFNQYFHETNANILPYGIPDKRVDNAQYSMKGKIVFAIIGGIGFEKGQDIFLRAVMQLTQAECDKSEFWLIGTCLPEFQYGKSVLEQVEAIPEAKWLGELTREEIEKVYKNIDVIVVPSRQETMSIVMTEVFMYGKIGIVTNAAGIAKYVEDGENGFVFENEDIDSLSRKISGVLDNREKLDGVGRKARQTYEKYFTLEAFGDRLEKAIQGV